jgi:pyrrolidone-carboxylate peptidase
MLCAPRHFTPERVAINMDDFPIPDNVGNQPQGEPIVAGGPVGYFSTLPIYAIVTQLKKAHNPAAIANSAGTYLCNRLFYSVRQKGIKSLAWNACSMGQRPWLVRRFSGGDM